MSGEIRAGGAYVELYAEDEQLRAALLAAPTAMAQAAARVTAAAAAGSAAVTASAVASASTITATATRSSLLTRTLSAGGTATAAAYRFATGSIIGMTVALGSAAAASALLGARSGVVGSLISGTIARSGTIAAGGFVASLAGALTGSSALRSAGAMAGRVAFAGGVVRGFQSGGITGALSGAFRGAIAGAAGAGIVGSVSALRSGVVSLFGLPGLAVRGLTAGLAGLQRGLGAVVPGFGAVATLGQRTASALAAANGVTVPLGVNLSGLAGSVLSVGKYLAGLAVGGFAAATKAGSDFAAKAAEVTKRAKETGVSIQAATAAAYGTGLAAVLISPEQIAAGNSFSQLMQQLGAVAQVAWAQVGAAAVPVLTEYAQLTFGLVRGLALWLNANQPAITSAIRVAGAVATVAAGVATLTGGLFVLAPAVGLILNPFTLLGAALAAGAAYWLTYSSNGEAALGAIQTRLTSLFDTGTTALNGIVDALASGDLALAAEIGLAGLYASFLTLTGDVRGLFVDLTASLADILSGGWMDALNNGLTWIENQISSLTAELSKWVTWFQEKLGLIDSAKAKALKDGADKTRDETITARNAQAARDNAIFRQERGDVTAEIGRDRDRRRKAIEDEQQAAQERLQTARDEAAAKRKEVDAKLAAASANVTSAPARVAETVAAVNRSTLGGLGASRSGTVGFKTLEDKIGQQTEIARETRDLLKNNLSFA